MQIERLQPKREYYESEGDYLSACLQAELDYRSAIFRHIDRLGGIQTNPTSTKSAEEIKRVGTQTINDYLSEHPNMLKRYKEIGPLALLELF